MYERILLESLKQSLFKNKIIILYGPRQVGKTTIVKKILNDFPEKSQYYLADSPNVKELFEYESIDSNLKFLTQFKLIVLDEAQNIPKIGKVLKIIHDTYPEIQLVVTGSNSFDLADKLSEPLTGRSLFFKLFPLSVKEIILQDKPIFAKELLPKLLIWGSYPEIYSPKTITAFQALENIAENYLYKDIFTLLEIKKPQLLQKLLQLLALQIGSQVSFLELANNLQTTIATVENYIDILEKAFIIFRLPAFSRNSRREVTKTRKIYFYDLGIRNYLISNLNELSLRSDIGALWENFLVVERLKNNNYSKNLNKSYFWRNYAQAEIDYLEESGGTLQAFEFKYNSSKKAKLPKAFSDHYPEASFEVINPENFLNFLI